MKKPSPKDGFFFYNSKKLIPNFATNLMLPFYDVYYPKGTV